LGGFVSICFDVLVSSRSPLQDWDLNKSLSLPQMYSSARMAIFFAGAASLYFVGSAFFGDSKKKSH
jgi:hypothetical protein